MWAGARRLPRPQKKGGRVQNTLFGLFSFTSPQLSRKKDIKE